MNIALPFCKHDRAQALRWLSWTQELGGVSAHRLFILPAKGQEAPTLPSGWASVTVLQDDSGVESDWHSGDVVRDAAGPNSMIRAFAWHFHLKKLGPWMFIEPDCLPVSPEWADRIEAEYRSSGKRFMGARVKVKDVPEHSSGNMVLPEDAALCVGLMLPRHAKFGARVVEVAFDIAAAAEVLANFHETRLIQHVFRADPFADKVAFESRISPDAVVYHADKTGSLLPFLRETNNLKGGDAQCPKPPRGSAQDRDCTAAPTFQPKAAENVVHTYFSPCSGATRIEQEKLIDLWRQSWERNGWTCVVLTEDDANRHPRYSEWCAAFLKLPFTNPKQYEMACFLRWVAMAQAGGGLMTDYDVMNFGFKPDQLEGTPEKLRLFCAHVPCVVHGTGEQFAWWADQFISSNAKSDMHCFENLGTSGLYRTGFECAEWPKEGKLIHFSHAACKPATRTQVLVPMLDPDRGLRESQRIPIPAKPEPATDKELVEALSLLAAKNGLAKARIVKLLNGAKLSK